MSDERGDRGVGRDADTAGGDGRSDRHAVESDGGVSVERDPTVGGEGGIGERDSHADGKGPDTEHEGTTGRESAPGRSYGLPDGLVAVALREYRIVVRSRWTAGVAVLFGVFSAAVLAFGASTTGPSRFGAVAASLAELGVYLVPLAGLVFGYDAVVGAAASGRLELLFSLPVSHGRVVLGKYLGRAVALAGALVAGFVPGAALTLWFAGVPSVGVYAAVVLAAVATALCFLALGVLVSTVAPRETSALGGALVAWLWFVLLGDLAALGAIGALDLPEAAVTAMVLTNPADCFRVLALARVDTVAGGFADLIASASLSVPLVAAALVAWTGGALGLAAWRVRSRRL